ncbi:MAG: class I SAM-dependent methyltransferase [Candidatus Sigynarchaeota archaeon]
MDENGKPHRHEHGGRSTRGLIDPGKLLRKIGLKEGETFLDLGCGDGYVAIEAASKFIGPAGKVIAIDVDPGAIEKVKVRVKELGAINIEASIADATKHLPLPDASVTTCLVANVLHGFVVNKEADQVLKELFRVLKNGGKIVIVEFKKKRYLPGPPFEDRLAPTDVDKLLAAKGCNMSFAFNAGLLHYARVFLVP